MFKQIVFLFLFQIPIWIFGKFAANARQQQAELDGVLWHPDLTQEFKIQYREQFGQIDTSSIDLQYGQYRFLTENTANQQAELDNQKRRDFAEYMVKRLTEFHTDNYIKTKPEMRPVYETKDKISNIHVEFNEEFRFQMKYNFAGNILDLILHNPYCKSRIRIEMDSHSFGPTPQKESKIIVEKNINKSMQINSTTEQINGITSLGLTQDYQKWTQTITASTFFSPTGTSTREHRVSFGVGSSF